MKILILKQNVTDQATLDKGLILVKQEAASIGLTLDFTQMVFNNPLTSFPFSNDTNSNGFLVNPMSFLGTWDIGFDEVCLIYDWTKVSPQPTNPADNGSAMQIPVQWYNTYPEVFADFFLHELCHFFFFKTGRLDITHNYDPAFTQKPRADWYLFLLRGLITHVTDVTYKYFKPSEIVGLKPELVQLLDKARDMAGVPFKITSGFRTPLQNLLVGGVNESSHEKGLAVDIWVKDTVSGGRILLALAQVGFKRFGLYTDNHIHVDIDPTKPSPCYWIN